MRIIVLLYLLLQIFWLLPFSSKNLLNFKFFSLSKCLFLPVLLLIPYYFLWDNLESDIEEKLHFLIYLICLSIVPAILFFLKDRGLHLISDILIITLFIFPFLPSIFSWQNAGFSILEINFRLDWLIVGNMAFYLYADLNPSNDTWKKKKLSQNTFLP